MDKARWLIPGATLPKGVVSLGGRFGCSDRGETANTQAAARPPPPRLSRARRRDHVPTTHLRINMASMAGHKDKKRPFMHSDCDKAATRSRARCARNRERIAISRKESPSMPRFV